MGICGHVFLDEMDRGGRTDGNRTSIIIKATQKLLRILWIWWTLWSVCVGIVGVEREREREYNIILKNNMENMSGYVSAKCLHEIVWLRVGTLENMIWPLGQTDEHKIVDKVAEKLDAGKTFHNLWMKIFFV